MAEQVKDCSEKLAAGVHITTDEDWAAIEPLWSRWKRRDKRQVLDAALIYLRCRKLGLRSLPPPYDRGHEMESAVYLMIRFGHWTSAFNAMERLGSPTVAGLDTSRFDRRVERHKPATCRRDKPSSI